MTGASVIAAALLTQQVLTQTPCYVTKPSLCPEEKFTMTIIEPEIADGRMTILEGVSPHATDVGFRSLHRLHHAERPSR
jgi:hypothetical protein